MAQNCIRFCDIHGPKAYKFMTLGDIHRTTQCKFVRFGVLHCPKPCKLTKFGDMNGPKPCKLIRFGDMHGPKPCKLLRFGDMHGPKPCKLRRFSHIHGPTPWAHCLCLFTGSLPLKKLHTLYGAECCTRSLCRSCGSKRPLGLPLGLLLIGSQRRGTLTRSRESRNSVADLETL